MKICAAQLKTVAGDLHANIAQHLSILAMASDHKIDCVIFPELSLTGYEPALAKSLSMTLGDDRLAVFDDFSNRSGITAIIGVPLMEGDHVFISLVFFEAGKERQFYSKQLLHTDETPFFHPGEKDFIFPLGRDRLAPILCPAICYESLQSVHIQKACSNGATLYATSVAKNADSIARAYDYFPFAAKEHGLPIVMANAYGACDGGTYLCHGSSAVWNAAGQLMAQLLPVGDGLVGLDLKTQQAIHLVF